MFNNLIEKNEGSLPVIRHIGFWLMISGIVSLLVSSFLTCDQGSSIISVSFFLTMIGFSLAFPSLLEGVEGLSTMRIIVFMMANVVCMLLLKIGWEKGVKSLADIGLNQYWVGVIAFTFGAKATQSFFESKMAVPGEVAKTGVAALQYTNADIAKLAVAQNEQYLKVKFLNIVAISDTVKDISQQDSHVIAIYLKDDNVRDIPAILDVKMADGSTRTITTEIVKKTGTAIIQYSQLGTQITNNDDSGSFGSICCGVKSTVNPDFKGVVTAAHIYTHGNYDDSYNGTLNYSQQTEICLNGDVSGKWYYKVMNQEQDLAVAMLNAGQTEDANYLKFNNGYYLISDKDVKTSTANITMLSRNNKTTTAFIIDYNVGLDVSYDSGPSYKKNLILIGSTNDRQTTHPISEGGDSGSCIYHTESKKLIGILLGRADNFSLVLPIQDTLKSFNLITI